MGQLSGKVAVVTGAGRGIGRAIAVLFADEGAKVAVVSRSKAGVDAVVDEIAKAGGAALGVVCDVSSREQVLAAVAKTVEAFGTVDVLVNNAHDTNTMNGSVLDTTEEMYDQQMRSGLMSTAHFMQACFPYLKQNRGKVINFGSGAGIIGAPNFAPYAATKEAIRAISRVAAREWGEHKITVNVICPMTMTDSLEESMKDPAVTLAVSQNALGIPGRPLEQVAPVALFLATEASQYMTGHTFNVDGGRVIDAAR